VFLNQLKFMKDEPRPENDGRKLRILGVLLQNMGVGFRSAATVAVPGVNVRFATHNLQEYCTAYLDDKSGKPGWFGRKGENLAALPRGRHDFADVTYHVVDYGTAPIPDCIILGGQRAHPRAIRSLPEKVEGIKVSRKADLLYFLHTAYVARPVTDREHQQMTARRRPFVLPTVLKYVLHYTDGQTAEIPVVLEKQIDHWLKDDSLPLEGAQIGWSRPLAGADGKRAVVYSMQAANPRPDVEIKTIDVVRASTRATPAVLAITTGKVISSGRASGR
jgi:beta-galactosidase